MLRCRVLTDAQINTEEMQKSSASTERWVVPSEVDGYDSGLSYVDGYGQLALSRVHTPRTVLTH